VDQIRIYGRNTQGVRLINLEDADQLVSASVAPAEDEELPAPAPATPEAASAPTGADEAAPV
jgi:DNA gyrase/topoisomerase IV subunit A